MTPHAITLFFILCGTPDPAAHGEHCEDGAIKARTCAAAEAFLRAGMQAGQVLHVTGCERVETVEVRR